VLRQANTHATPSSGYLGTAGCHHPVVRAAAPSCQRFAGSDPATPPFVACGQILRSAVIAAKGPLAVITSLSSSESRIPAPLDLHGITPGRNWPVRPATPTASARK